MRLKPLVPLILKQCPGASTSVSGWVQSCRKMKNVAFIDINDGSSIQSLNVVTTPDKVAGIQTGACVKIDGKLVESSGKQKLELQAENISIYGNVGSDYPLQKKYHSSEFLRTLPHLRWKTRHNAQILRTRSWMLSRLSQFFDSRRMVQVNTPVLTSSDCEGAGEVFELSKGPEFFGKNAYLTVSSQLHLEAYVAALNRVWTLTPAFRAEASDTNRHLSEFWLVEAELAFIDREQLIGVCIDMIHSIIPSAEIAQGLLDAKRSDEERAELETRWDWLGRDWPVISYTEALDLVNAESDLRPLKWGENIPSLHEKFIAGEIMKAPTVITDYPLSLKPFYMSKSSETTADCFDILLPEIGEIVGGSMRESDYDTLLKNIKASGMSLESIEWYLDLRKHGSFPHGGYGLGLERMIMYACGLDNIRDAVGFVRHFKNLPC